MGQRARAVLILALAACGEPPRPAAPTPAPPATAAIDASAPTASAASIACGLKSCTATAEYCDSGDAGAACKPLPAACASNRTCACLKSAGVAGNVCDDTGGQIVNATR